MTDWSFLDLKRWPECAHQEKCRLDTITIHFTHFASSQHEEELPPARYFSCDSCGRKWSEALTPPQEASAT